MMLALAFALSIVAVVTLSATVHYASVLVWGGSDRRVAVVRGMLGSAVTVGAVWGSLFCFNAWETAPYEAVEARYGVSVEHRPTEGYVEPGEWKIDGEWRTCYTEDFEWSNPEAVRLFCVDAQDRFVEVSEK